MGLLSFFTFASTPTVYSLPGANHALISGCKPSLDATRQQNYIRTIIKRTTESKYGSDHQTIVQSADAALDDHLPTRPFCFIADTDSFPFVLDSGANRFIINDATLFHTFVKQSGRVKGIGGKTVPLVGTGTIRLPLKSNSGIVDTITITDAMYIPTSPYNLVLPQLLVRRLKELGYYCKHAYHDDTQYIFEYRPRAGEDPPTTNRQLTIPIGANDLFSVHSNEGYTAFFRKATYYAPEWNVFAGSTHIILQDDNEEDSSQILKKLREFNSTDLTLEKLREVAGKQPQNTIPHLDIDFEPVKSQPVDTPFDLQGKEQTIYRAILFLEDWKPGHYAEYNYQPLVDWRVGDCVVWQYDAPHMAANLGLNPRYTLQITGHI